MFLAVPPHPSLGSETNCNKKIERAKRSSTLRKTKLKDSIFLGIDFQIPTEMPSAIFLERASLRGPGVREKVGGNDLNKVRLVNFGRQLEIPRGDG